MKCEVQLFQFAEDPLKNEGRNIAAVWRAGGKSGYVAVGKRADGSIDLAEFRAFSGYAFPVNWAYREWLSWFDGISSCKDAPLNSLATSFAASGLNIKLGDTLEIDIEDPRHLNSVIEEVTSQTIKRPALDPDASFQQALEELVVALGIGGGSISTEILVEFEDSVAWPSLTFDYFVEMPRPVGFLVVPLMGQLFSEEKAKAAMRTFYQATAAGLLDQGRCIALIGPCSDKAKPFSISLAMCATKIDITRPDAMARIQNLLGAT